MNNFKERVAKCVGFMVRENGAEKAWVRVCRILEDPFVTKDKEASAFWFAVQDFLFDAM